MLQNTKIHRLSHLIAANFHQSYILMVQGSAISLFLLDCVNGAICFHPPDRCGLRDREARGR